MDNKELEVNRIKREIEQREAELKILKNKVDEIYRNCYHRWGEPVYNPIYHEAYTIPGDPPGTCGVDWRGPTWVEAKTIPRWKRRCAICGKEEETTKTEEVKTYRPNW
jgi:hypothetical protein